jgi:cytochrome c oxidase assembly factor CtaG
LLVAVILFRQWVRDDEREQRAADRDGDAAVEAYNAWLTVSARAGEAGAGPARLGCGQAHAR